MSVLWRCRTRQSAYHAQSLAQISSRILDGTTERFRAPFMIFYSTISLSKKPPEESTASTVASATAKKSAKQGRKALSEEQQTVFDLVVKKRKSVFFTGPAGTGKSVLLKKIIQSLATKYKAKNKRIGVTASTGLAAQNIGGTTLHRFAGIGLGQAPTPKLIEDIVGNKIKRKRWRDVKVLIVDEISMIDCILFDKLDAIARAVKKKDIPFGGIQLVLCGDFFQLPPVTKGVGNGSLKFCFEAKAWDQAIKHTIDLAQIYRQRDPKFTAMLNEIREGHLSPITIEKFRNLSRPVADNGTETTELFPLRQEADRANARRLNSIEGLAYSYAAKDGGIVTNPTTRKMLLNDCIAPETLTLKEGAHVMLIKNMDETLINGSQGRIIGFEKSETDESSVSYPVVSFTLHDGSTRTRLCEPEEWAVERWVPEPSVADGWVVEKLATRVQVPLLLAWALSIHKAQGQTLERVKVDLNRIFEAGQAYVALSRATSMEGLQVLNFDPNKITVHPKAKAFYSSLSKKTGT